MVASGVVIAVVSFLLWIVLRSVNIYLSDAYLFILFSFAFVVGNREFSVFYLLWFLIAMVLDLAVNQIRFTTSSSVTVGKFQFNGFGMVMLGLFAGLVIYFMIVAISSRVGGNIVGVPDLSVSSAGEVGKQLEPTFESHLGIIENRVTFVLFDVLMVFGPLLLFWLAAIPLVGDALINVAPFVIVPVALGVFHVAAYSVSLSLMVWASIAFLMFIVSRYLLKDSLAADTAHWLNNLVVSARRGLQIV